MNFFERIKQKRDRKRQAQHEAQVELSQNLDALTRDSTPQPKGNPASVGTVGLPKALADDVNACMASYKTIQENRAMLSHELTFIVEQIVNEYLPETIQQYHDAAEQGQTAIVVDGVYTAAQVCQQNIRMIKLKLENIIEETSSRTQTEMLVQRNFLMEQLEIEAAPAADTAIDLTTPESKKTTGKGASANAGAAKTFEKGDRVRLDLRRLVDDSGGLKKFEAAWNWKVERDYDVYRSPVGVIKSVGAMDDFYHVQFYFHGHVENVPAQYLTAHPKTKGELERARQKKEQKRWLAPKAAAEKLGLSVETLRRLTRDQEIPASHRPQSGHVRYSPDDIEAALKYLEDKPEQREVTLTRQEKRQLLTPTRAARQLGLSLTNLTKLTAAGHIPSSYTTPGGYRRYTPTDLKAGHEYMESINYAAKKATNHSKSVNRHRIEILQCILDQKHFNTNGDK